MVSILLKTIAALRPINLIIIAITQSILYFYLILGVFDQNSILPQLTYSNAVLFILVTTCIAASGYVINDYFDRSTDIANQPEHQPLKSKAYLLIYATILIIGFFISLYIAYSIDNLPLVIIYPVAVVLLYYYSRNLKLKGFVGNIIVAGFTAFVSWIMLVAEPQLIRSESTQLLNAWKLILVFGIFSFLINLMREIVKDIEDMKGDAEANSQSLPITIGVERTKVMIYFFSAFLIVLIITWMFSTPNLHPFNVAIFNTIFILAPTIRSILQLHKAKTPYDFHRISTLYKWIMMSGLIGLMLITKHLLT